MAGPNFGILQPIEQPRAAVVGQIPIQPPQPNQLDQFAKGVMSGAETGSNLASQAVLRQSERQKMDQAAQLFPSQLTAAKNAAETSNLELKDKKRTDQDIEDGRKAALAGPDKYGEFLSTRDPVKYQEYQLKTAQAKQAFSTAAKTDADTSKQVLENYDMAIDKAAQVTRSAAQGATPEMKQKIYAFGVAQLPSNIQKLMPPQYDDDTGMAMSRLAHESQANVSNKIMAGDSPLVKDQKTLNVVNQRIQADQQAGQQPHPEDVTMAKTLQDSISKATQKAPEKNPFDTAIANTQAGEIKAMEGVSQQTDKLITDTDLGMNILKKIPEGYVGPIAGRVGLGFESTDVQKLDKILAGIPLIQKSATLGQSVGARLFMSELEQMKTSSGTTKINAPALKWILQEQNTEAKIQKFDNWNKMNSMYKNASEEVRKNWLSSHPQPTEPRVEVVDPQGKHQTIPYTQMNAYLQATPGAERW